MISIGSENVIPIENGVFQFPVHTIITLPCPTNVPPVCHIKKCLFAVPTTSSLTSGEVPWWEHHYLVHMTRIAAPSRDIVCDLFRMSEKLSKDVLPLHLPLPRVAVELSGNKPTWFLVHYPIVVKLTMYALNNILLQSSFSTIGSSHNRVFGNSIDKINWRLLPFN